MNNIKSMRLQVLIEPNIYNDLYKILKELNITFKSDSESVRYAIMRFVHYETNVKIDILRYQSLLKNKNEELEQIRNKLEQLDKERINLFKDLEIYKDQNRRLSRKIGGIYEKKKVKSKQRKKKSK